MDINCRDQHGDTPLIIAVKGGFLEIVEVLLKNSAEPDKQNDKGNTALHYSIAQKYQEITDLLIENRAAQNI